MNVPEPRANPCLVGHAAAEEKFVQALRSGRLHHGWLISGAPGVGKATVAFRFARRLLAGPGATLAVDPADPVFRRVAAGSHPDLLTVERAFDERRKRERTEIVVEDVRAVADFLRLTPAEGGFRVVVIDGAEALNRNAANALLKVLEEPPPRAVLLLVCAAPGRLPPTIRSRCVSLRLAPLPEVETDQLLALYRPELAEADRQRISALADGSPGRALLLSEAEGVRLAGAVDEVIEALPAIDMSRAYDIADTVVRVEGAFSTFMDLLRANLAAAVRDYVRGRADPAQARLAMLRPLDAWTEVWQALSRLQDETERFALDKRQAIVSGLGLLRASG
jgi:DNA polymerase III subunit delta'